MVPLFSGLGILTGAFQLSIKALQLCYVKLEMPVPFVVGNRWQYMQAEVARNERSEWRSTGADGATGGRCGGGQ